MRARLKAGRFPPAHGLDLIRLFSSRRMCEPGESHKPKPARMVIVTACFILAVAGCRSSGVMQRKAQHLEAYRSLDAATRSLVDKGKVQNGMDTNAVFISWGQPTDAFAVDLPGGGQRLIWNYEEKWAYEFKQRAVSESGSITSTRFGVERSENGDQPRRWRVPITYVAKSVMFAGGRVIEWKKYDPPAFSQPTAVSPETGRRF
jgi:hypothetical protein